MSSQTKKGFYVDPWRREHLERLAQSQHNVSHQAFVSTTRGYPEKGNFGGKEGLFSLPLGMDPGEDAGNDASGRENANRANPYGGLQQLGTMRIGKVKKGGPGAPNVCIGRDFEHFANDGFAQTEKLNCVYKLGMQQGFRSNVNHSGRGFVATAPADLFDGNIHRTESAPSGGGGYGEETQRKRPISKAAQLSRRAVHTAAWNPGAKTRMRPTETFSRFAHMTEPFLDNPNRELHKTMQTQHLPTITNKPFVPATTCKDALPCSSIVFHHAEKQRNIPDKSGAINGYLEKKFEHVDRTYHHAASGIRY